MKLKDFFSRINNDDKEESAVLYLSQQNSNLTSEFPFLMPDVLGFGTLPETAFGQRSPEAINLWIGILKIFAYYIYFFSVVGFCFLYVFYI